MRRLYPIEDSAIRLIDRYGGPRAAYWATRAQAVIVDSAPKARLAYLCLLRATSAAIDYDAPENVRRSCRYAQGPLGEERQMTPVEVASRVIADDVGRLARAYPRACVAPERARWRPLVSADAKARWKYKHAKRRVSRRERRRWNMAERLQRSIQAERAVEWWRHPSSARLQEQDDRELRLAGERAY